MKDRNTVYDPYRILKVPRNASLEGIEEAYDRIFDRYEALASEGDEAATQKLYELNDARDALVDAARRAEIDADLSEADAQRAAARRGEAVQAAPGTLRLRPRGRPSAQTQSRTLASMFPWFMVVAVLAVALVVGFLYLRNSGSPEATPGAQESGDVVATVSGRPIYRREYNERVARDKENALNDPVFGALFNNFEGITGTRALDALSQDALDKLVNFEVIMQQAEKEGLYPTEQQQQGLINNAKATDLKGGETFEQFLASRGITEEQYNRTVVQNVVYTVMADTHMPKTGTAEERTNAWIEWICKTRQGYEVKINLTFIILDNPACTSGLPADLPLPGIDQTVPEAEPTAIKPAEQQATPAATGTAAQ
jgi:curved DNA-binding protein CbpA